MPEAEGVEKELENPTRLGQYKIGTNVKPRLLRVTVRSDETKTSIMKRAHKLNTGVTDKREKIYINHDLTPKEREVEKELRDELRTRRENGEEDLVIRNGKIVKRPARQSTDKDLEAAAGHN